MLLFLFLLNTKLLLLHTSVSGIYFLLLNTNTDTSIPSYFIQKP